MQDYQVSVVEVSSTPIAVVRERATRADLIQKIYFGCDVVWKFIRNESSGVKSTGHNVVVYLNEPGKNLLETPQGLPVEIGAQVLAPFPSTGQVVCSSTPGGTAAVVTHVGPYDQMCKGYDALFKWCKENQRAGAGPCWEIYGHWNDDPKQLRTDIYCLLK